MRIRLSLTLNIDRARYSEPIAEREVQLDALMDRAEPHRIGFHAEPGRTEPIDWEDHR